MIGTANTVRRDCPPSHRFDLGRSSSPTSTVASSANKMPALISDARTGNNCGGHTAGRLAAQAQLGRTGCAIQSTSNPRSTVPTATAGERVAPTVWMGIEPDYRSSTTAARRLRRLILRDSVNQSRRGVRLAAELLSSFHDTGQRNSPLLFCAHDIQGPSGSFKARRSCPLCRPLEVRWGSTAGAAQGRGSGARMTSR